jgi:hypothetical protein
MTRLLHGWGHSPNRGGSVIFDIVVRRYFCTTFVCSTKSYQRHSRGMLACMRVMPASAAALGMVVTSR